MAKPLDQFVQDALGAMQLQLLKLLAEKDKDRERIAELEAEVQRLTASSQAADRAAKPMKVARG